MTPEYQALSYQKLTQQYFQNAFLLHQQSHSNPWSQTAFVDCLDKPYFGWQAIKKGEVVGYYIGLNVVGEVTLMDIGISKKHQGLGFGRDMLEHFFKQSQLQNGFEIWLEVRESNSRAIKLYETSGFELIEQRKNYYQLKSEVAGQPDSKEDALIMKKVLVP
ncbi:ribosomal-protein-alanine N-acetyltransferase [Alteromonadaceae bacterium M269]|nr:ribosomal-protein-alanine N-acetyltransferase [Alteromonadaceae bacterium M269]